MMASQSYTPTLQALIASLKAKGIIKDARVEDAMLKVDRRLYCKPDSEYPYRDAPETINYNATISAPHMHAYALEALKEKLVEGAKVLDVGAGSGYLTACMAHMVGTTGTVVGIEHIKELVEQARLNIEKDCSELLTSRRIQLIESDGRLGYPEHAPYDVIHVGATTPEMPQKLVEQLKVDGLMVLPVQRGPDQMFEKVKKFASGEIKIEPLLRVVYVPLTDVQSQLRR